MDLGKIAPDGEMQFKLRMARYTHANMMIISASILLK
jgi:hypothetical protein